MSTFKRLLAQVDSEKGLSQPVIQRVLEVAQKGFSELVLIAPTYVDGDALKSVLSAEQIRILQQHAVEKSEAGLNLLADKLRQQGWDVSTRLGWRPHSYEAVIEAAIELQADVVFTAVSHHSRLARLMVTPEERQLLRLCPCPVWLVKNTDRKGPVVAAWDVAATDPDHKALNHRIGEMAREAAHGLGSRWLSLSAFSVAPMLYPYPGGIPVDIPELERAGLSHLRFAAREYAEPLGLSESDTLVEPGAPRDVLYEQAEKLQASLLVVGTVARHGFGAFLLGNTIEHLIDELNCDVLAVKPAGFTCPITFEH